MKRTLATCFLMFVFHTLPLSSAINPDIVKGKYFYIQFARQFETLPTVGLGALTFATTAITTTLKFNNGRSLADTGAYEITSDSHLWAAGQSDDFVGITNGLVAIDGSIIAGGQSDQSSRQDTTFFFGIRAGSNNFGQADLTGTYSFIESSVYSTTDSFGYASAVGKLTFDSSGKGTFSLSQNAMGQMSQGTGTLTYSMSSDGTGTMKFGSLSYSIALSGDRNYLIMMRNEGVTADFLIAQKDTTSGAHGTANTVGPYALLRMASDYAKINFTRDVPYVGLGNVTSSGTGTLDGLIIDFHEADFVGPIFNEPFSATFTVAADGTMQIKPQGTKKQLRAIRVGRMEHS